MAKELISERVKSFIFKYIDSVELLEVLLCFNANAQKHWTADAMAAHLRSSSNSVHQRFQILKDLGLIHAKLENSEEYFFKPNQQETIDLINELAEAYKVHRHTILTLIFSPLKRVRDFAQAFRKGEKD